MKIFWITLVCGRRVKDSLVTETDSKRIIIIFTKMEIFLLRRLSAYHEANIKLSFNFKKFNFCAGNVHVITINKHIITINRRLIYY